MYAPYASNLQAITAGPQNEMWFTTDQPDVAKSTVLGDMLEYPTKPTLGYPTSMTAGPNHTLWVTMQYGSIGRVAPDGHLQDFPVAEKLGGPHSQPWAITNGPDNSLWFVTSGSTSHIVRSSMNGQMRGFALPSGARIQWLTLGSDGKLWFTDSGTNKVGNMDAAGAVREFSVPTANAGLSGICQGPDGKLWFLEQTANKVGNVTTTGSFQEYPIPTYESLATAIVAGPDGALWFTEYAGSKIGRITTSGTVAELTLKGEARWPFEIAIGSDKNVWFTEEESYGIIGRVELNPIKNSKPIYSEIALSLKAHPQLGEARKLPLSVTVYNMAHHLLTGHYPYPIHLTSSDSENARLSQTTVTDSTARLTVAFSGHYTPAYISANADGGGQVQIANVMASTPRFKRLPSAGEGLGVGPNRTLWACLLNGKIASYALSGTLHVYRATTSFKWSNCSIHLGPDGNMWFADNRNNRIGMITATGKVTFYALSNEASPYDLTLGSDGAFWFGESFETIGRITTAGGITLFTVASNPISIVSGPDGNLWYDTNDGIYKMTTAGKSTLVRGGYFDSGMWSADNELWFYDPTGLQLNEMSTGGRILHKYTIPNNCLPFDMTFGPQHSIWYVDPGNNCVARLSLSGKFIVVPTYAQRDNNGLISAIVVGQDGDLWFTESSTRGLGWVDPKTI